MRSLLNFLVLNQKFKIVVKQWLPELNYNTRKSQTTTIQRAILRTQMAVQTLGSPIVDYQHKLILAPMVRVGILPFRALAREYGADVVYSEEIVDKKLLSSTRTVNCKKCVWRRKNQQQNVHHI